MTTKAEMLDAIRENCIQCSAGSAKEVKLCVMTNCPLFPYRMGKDLNPSRTLKNLSYGGAKNANAEKLQGYQELTDNGDLVTTTGEERLHEARERAPGMVSNFEGVGRGDKE